MGRSRGGLTTKIHAIVNALGLLIDLVLSEGQAWDGHYANGLFGHLQPRTLVLADRPYDADVIRAAIASKDAWANIPPMLQRRFRPVFSRALYKARNLVGRFFNKLKRFHAVATRYDKQDDNYPASVKLAAIRIWLRHDESVTWPGDALSSGSSR